jgi:hypothetical protein
MFGDQIFMTIERCFNHHKVYSDQNCFIFLSPISLPQIIKMAFDLNWLYINMT